MKRLIIVDELTLAQRRELMMELSSTAGRETSIEVIEIRIHIDSVGPHCAADQVIRSGSADRLQRYKCRSCGKKFNALTSTPRARLRKK